MSKRALENETLLGVFQNIAYTDPRTGVRSKLAQRLREKCIENISSEEVVVSAGLSEYKRGSDLSIRSVFERADSLMYRDKKALKEINPNRFVR